MADEEILREAAEHFLDVNELCEDEDLDVDDHVAVLIRNFCSSDCDDFAHVLNLMTGWQTVRATWVVPNRGIGHHTLVREPGGRLLDASGWVDEAVLRKRYLGKRPGVAMSFADALPLSSSIYGDDDLQRIVGVVRALPHAPYSAPWFREMSDRPVVDGELDDRVAGIVP